MDYVVLKKSMKKVFTTGKALEYLVLDRLSEYIFSIRKASRDPEIVFFGFPWENREKKTHTHTRTHTKKPQKTKCRERSLGGPEIVLWVSVFVFKGVLSFAYGFLKGSLSFIRLFKGFLSKAFLRDSLSFFKAVLRDSYKFQAFYVIPILA